MHIIYVYNLKCAWTTLYKVLNNGAYSQQKVNYNALINCLCARTCDFGSNLTLML